MTRNPGFAAVTAVLTWTTFWGGCQQTLMPTPNLYVKAKDNPFRAVPQTLQNNLVDVLYATDRAPEPNKNGQLHYGYQRSKSLAFGVATVQIGRDLSWDDLVRESRTAHRDRPLPLAVEDIHELGRFPADPDLGGFHGDRYIPTPAVVAARTASERQLTGLLSEHLAKTPRHEVFIYVHGYSNTFEDAAFVMAEIWHFLGRQGVPVIYTWPAGSPEGAMAGYTCDRESGEFTEYHLRHFLRTVAACPDVKKIHLIAHSRGTDVLMTALRELNLECQGAGKSTGQELKLGNLVLAAADLDFEITSQRITAELLPLVPERMTVYVSPTDRAIGLADWIFGSRRRIGQLRWTDMTPEQQKGLGAVSKMQIIDVVARTDFLGHSYFHESPAVSSDLILLLRDNRGPGAENGRSLIQRYDNFWEIDAAYPRQVGP